MFPGYPPSQACLGCGRRMHVLCECAFRTVYGAGKLVKSSFEGEKVRG